MLVLANRLQWGLGLLLLLGACHLQSRTVVPAATTPVSAARPWAATIADRLYERQILSAAGRDELQRRIATRSLAAEYQAPGRLAPYADTLTNPAMVLQFCADAFQRELLYRLDLGKGASLISGEPIDSVTQQRQRQFAAALHDAHGDTLAAFRHLRTPPQLIEDHIRAEDSVLRTTWTIYSPLSAHRDTLPPAIAASRSVQGKTRTRTARDYYELGLLTAPQYAEVRRELSAGKLTDELTVTNRALQLALDAASYPVRRQVFDSVLTRLAAVGVLTPAGQQRALADSQVVRSLDLFEVLPYCARAHVFDLHALPREPALLYPRLLAEVAALWPAFRYTGVQVKQREDDSGGAVVDELVELSFVADGRRYATSFTQGYRRKDGQSPSPAAGAEVSEDFAAGINQWLRDQGRPERLHQAHTPDEQSVYGNDRLGLLMLTPPQYEAWGSSTYFLSSEEQASQFTSAYLERALALYQRLGLLQHLTPNAIAAGRRQALSGHTTSYVQLLRCFPGLLVEMGGENAEAPGDYSRALRRVAAATRGAFRPTHVRDTFGGVQEHEQHSVLAFDCGRRHYRVALTSDLGWMDWRFVELMQRAVRENTPGRLYYLSSGDETGEYLYLTAAQATALRRAQPELFREHDADQARAQQQR